MVDIENQKIRNCSEEEIELTILMPCLNESQTIRSCINKAKIFLNDFSIYGEILVADNGSVDGSREIAKKLGARVIKVDRRGYGNAVSGGISSARGKYIIMGDADDSYDFSNLMPFVIKLREGFDLVMGNRFLGGIEEGAMPFLHKYVGNPVLSFIGRTFFKSPIKDFHCGLRGFSKSSAQLMELQTTGMEFASEMVIKASLLDMKVCEVPTTLSPDGRDRPPHLNTWRDGWRHLRFMLLFSPRWMFFYPGLILILIGLILSALTFFSPITINEISFDIHSLAYFNALVVIGFNMLLFAFQSRIYGYISGLIPKAPSFEGLFKYFYLERGILIGGIMIFLGITFTFYSIFVWAQAQFGDVAPQTIMRIVIPSISVIIMGTQIVLSSFFLSILGLKTKNLNASIKNNDN